MPRSILLGLIAWAGILFAIVLLNGAEKGFRAGKVLLPNGRPLYGLRARIVSLFDFVVAAGIIYGFWYFMSLMPQ
jgi:hypothetical protein